jgi:hypothetical protein
MMAEKKVVVSGPGAVRGTAPVVTKTVQSKPSTPASTQKSKTNANEVTKISQGITRDLGKVSELLATYLGSQTDVVTPPLVPTTPTDSGVTDALLQQILAGQETAAASAVAQARAERQSAYDILLSEFTRYGLQSLVEPLKGFIISGSSPAELTIQLQNSKAYQDRFKANEQRIAKGLSALSPAEYIAVEDQYQNIMRNYGLPESYYAKDNIGTQVGFQTLLANDVSATELEERVLTAQDRVLKANPEVSQALKAFYPDITNGDILAYTLDPQKGLDAIKRKVTAAEIGGAAISQGLTTGVTRAEELAAAGVTKAQAQEGYKTIAEVSPRGSLLSDIYQESPYGQTQAEQEIFNLAGSAEAARQRKKLTSLETAAFSGQAGVGALARERAGNL